jgi:hypothetical protein
MTCADLERILCDTIDGDGDAEFQAHLRSCPDCSELVGELSLIVNESGKLAEADEPPARVWVSIANQLRAEGIIHDPEGKPVAPVPAQPRRWRLWWLAPVAAAILAAGSYQLTHQKNSAPTPQVAQQAPSQPQAAKPAVNPQANQPARVAQEVAPSAPRSAPAEKSPAQAAEHPPEPAPARNTESTEEVAQNQNAPREISPPASAEDEQFLGEVSSRAPSMRTTYENQLRAVNAEILETQAYIKRNPGDMDARQHLMEVYQQKAMLYQLALDHIQ